LINKVGAFEKVSLKQFKIDMKSTFGEKYSDEEIEKMYEKITLPERATTGSAGYDIRSTINFTLNPNESIKIPTGIRVLIDEGWWLGCFPRSSLGFKYRLQLDNQAGIIDSDYYFAENCGHIFAKITNDSKNGKSVTINEGDRFIQAIFIPFGITYNDNTTEIRQGGIGSTNQ